MARPLRDIPNTSLQAAAEGYNQGFQSPEKSYWELNNDLIEEAYQRIGALESSPGADGVQASLDGNVVPVGEGLDVSDGVAVTSSSNPFNEARGKLPASGGALLLPPEPVILEDGQPATVKRGVSVIGWGMGHGQTGQERASTIQQTAANTDVLQFNDTQSIRCGVYRDFHVQGPDAPLQSNSPTTGAGIHINTPVADCELTRIRASHLVGPALKNTGGTTGCRFGHFNYGQVDCGNDVALIDFSQEVAWGWQFGQIDGYGTDTVTGNPSTVFDIGKVGAVGIDFLNVGGFLDTCIRQYQSNDGNIRIGIINCEPHKNGDYGIPMDAVIDAEGGRPVEIGQISLRTTKADAIYRTRQNPAGSHGHNDFGMVSTAENLADVTTGGAIWVVEDDTTAENVYRGPSADVDNRSAGALSVPIACLGDLQTVS